MNEIKTSPINNRKLLYNFLGMEQSMQRYAANLPRLSAWKSTSNSSKETIFKFDYQHSSVAKNITICIDTKLLDDEEMKPKISATSISFWQGIKNYLYRPVTSYAFGALGILGIVLQFNRNCEEANNYNLFLRLAAIGTSALYFTSAGMIKLKSVVSHAFANIEVWIGQREIAKAGAELKHITSQYRAVIYLDAELTATKHFLTGMIAHKNQQTGEAEREYLQALKSSDNEQQKTLILMALTNLYSKYLKDENKLQAVLKQIPKNKIFYSTVNEIKVALKDCLHHLEAGNYLAAKRTLKSTKNQCTFSIKYLDHNMALFYYKLRTILLLIGQKEQDTASTNIRAISIETRFNMVNKLLENIRILEQPNNIQLHQ